MFDNLPFLFPLLFVVAIGEWVLSLTWTPFYFRTGIPLFTASIVAYPPSEFSSHISEIEHKLQNTSWWRPAVVLKQLDTNEYAFRHHWWRSRNPLTGLIRVDELAGKVTITGYAYWSFLILPIFFLFIISQEILIFIVVFIFVIGINIAVQRSHYAKIAQIIEEVVSKG